MFRLDPDNVGRSGLLRDIPWLRHGFGTRLDSEWPSAAGLTWLRQVHSNLVIVAGGRTGLLGEGDALITNQAGTLLTVRTADCLPILICDVRNRAVAAVHAGWRGTVSGIAGATVEAMGREYGSRPEDLRAVIGPGIGECCFEVGPAVAGQFGTIFPERDDLNRRTRLDLAEANRRQLVAAGLQPEHMDVAAICTCCNKDVYESFRRDGEASGRMISGIGICV